MSRSKWLQSAAFRMPSLRFAPRAPHRFSGFTLVELMVVFAILALVMALAPASLGRMYETAQYRSAVRGIVTEMRAARQRAQSEGVEARFTVNLRERTYGMEGGERHAVPDSLQLRAVAARQETSADGQEMGIRFLPRGGATGGSVDLIRPSGSGVRLRVDWFSGRVEQEPASGEAAGATP